MFIKSLDANYYTFSVSNFFGLFSGKEPPQVFLTPPTCQVLPYRVHIGFISAHAVPRLKLGDDCNFKSKNSGILHLCRTFLCNSTTQLLLDNGRCIFLAQSMQLTLC